MAKTSASRAIISLSAYAANLDVVRRSIGPGVQIVAVVKANAYGHGLVEMARHAEAWGAAALGVARVQEGVDLREQGIAAPIIVFGHPDAGEAESAIEHNLTLSISTVAAAERIGELAHRMHRMARVHCKVDSGMGRQGFALEEAAEQLRFITRISHIDIEGIATHFPSADDPEDTFTGAQIKNFRALLKTLDRRGIPYESAHAANSAAIINFPASTFDMVRPGLMTYGIWPTRGAPQEGLLRPVLHWETRVSLIRDLEPGSSVSYGRTYTTPGRMRAAILPVGYADGYMHGLSNKAEVLIRGARCPVRGSVCMDQIIVDISHLPEVAEGDPAVLIGQDGEERITAEELAQRAGTIPYEVLTGIGGRVPREYVD